MSFRSTIVAAAVLAAANAHMTMQEPVIYSQDKALIDTAPLTPAQYPCHSQYGFEVTKMNSIAVGTPQKAVLKGSAIHGGGSCQLSVTLDTAPTKDSKFKVVKSFIGNCPSAPDAVLSYTLPAAIPNGKATFAWTWFSVLSGGPEMYMNCAPIEVTGGASDNTAFEALPDMLIANLGDATTCRSVVGSPLKFPNPGADVEEGAGGPAAAPPTGDCGATGTTPPATPPGNGNPVPSAAPPSMPSAAPPSVPSAAPPTAPSGAPKPPVSSGTPAPPVTPPTTPPTTPPVTPPTTGGTCTTNGALMCNGPSQFGLCNNGGIVWQAVAAGTTCVNGAIQKRSSFKAPYNGRIVRKSITFTA